MVYLLSQILDRSAERYCEREAFRCEGEGLTYGDLLRRANGLAHWLVDHGVKRGDRVGIYLNKSLESAISIYGIWKAGAAYVPLDPSAPLSRIAYSINHCSIRHLITHRSKRRKLPELLSIVPDVRWVVGIPDSLKLGEELGEELEEAERKNAVLTRCDWEDLPLCDHAPNVHLLAQDLAYIMYTSGSTGTPKGIMHTHYSGLSYAELVAETYGLTERDRIGNHSPLHFDISTLGFFAGPLVSATTVILPEAYTKMPASLSQLIQDESLTVWYSVPFALTQLWLRGVLSERDLSALRWVLFAGEPFPAKYLYALMQRLPNARFSNIYGPAEVNQCTYYHVPPLAAGEPVPEDIVPIGQVWKNSEGIVVDEADNLVKQGDIGELLIRTATMMSGYWQQPELTAKAFYKTEIANQPAVFYRTGDLVQADSNGQYRFIGRKDRQIKTRGYRVELDEVEAALVAHHQIEEAATYAIPYEAGSYQIEASVVLSVSLKEEKVRKEQIGEEQNTTETDIKRYLAERLPSYAIPARITILSTFPRTGTGKIDRRSLQTVAQQNTSPKSIPKKASVESS
ncbi:MAG: amino acid adenylation domain-containing protein [Cyanobacteria bacterium J06632_3]